MRVITALLLCGLASPAFAQNAPMKPGSPDEVMRNYTVRNMAKSDIVESIVTVPGQGPVSLTATKGKIAPNEVRSFQSMKDQCPQSITAKFADGKTVQSGPMTHCQDGDIRVFADKIDVGAR